MARRQIVFRSLFLTSCLVFCILFDMSTLSGDDAINPDESAFPIGTVGKTATPLWPRSANPLHALVVFTKWKDEAPNQTTAPYWASELFNGQPGSVNDYFDAVSFGQYKVIGDYLPKMYEMPYDSSYYSKSETYARDIVQMLDADPDVKLANYDNDGLDGIPNSGDDDGYVDYLILVPMSRPYDFILRLATGVMCLPLSEPYITHELRPYGEHIIVDQYSGCLVVASWKRPALGTIVAEIAHAYGALDLMDKEYSLPEIDSAGVGFWDLLGWGATGWGESTGIPVGPCAYNRMLMSSIGLGNSNLVDLYGARTGVRISDVGGANGTVYRAWLNSDEYFLIEFRCNDGNLYYDSQLPGSGLAIWHIQERESNSDETSKLCDLECADGRFRDAGYPAGIYPDVDKGGDNLDFWGHDASYTNAHAGNRGDSTDLFDGVKYTEFSDRTNPRSRAQGGFYSSGIEIFNIHRDGNDMVFDCNINFNPVMPPPVIPQLGLAFQRSKSRTAAQSATEKPAVYLVQYGPGSRTDRTVTVDKTTLTVRETTGFSIAEIQRVLEKGLFRDPEVRNASITRENVSLEEFTRVLTEYDLKTGDLDAARTPVRVQKAALTEEKQALPFVMYLRQNSPNPFNGETAISFILSAPGPVTLEVYNILGQKVVERDHGRMGAGSHTVLLSSAGLSSGVYFYRLRGAPPAQTRRLMVLR